MYEFRTRVRYSETDENGALKIPALINYFQDCSTFHSMDVGLTVPYLESLHRAWLLSYWDIYIDRIPSLGETLTIGTSPHAFRGVLARRNFWIQDAQQNFIARADSVWFLFDSDRQRPVRIEAGMIEPFGEMEDILKLPESNRRVDVPDSLNKAPVIRVAPHHIDSNHHVNNAQYIAIANDVLANAADIRKNFTGGRIRVEYRKAAVLSDILIPKYGKTTDGALIVSLQDETGEVYCNAEFR